MGALFEVLESWRQKKLPTGHRLQSPASLRGTGQVTSSVVVKKSPRNGECCGVVTASLKLVVNPTEDQERACHMESLLQAPDSAVLVEK